MILASARAALGHLASRPFAVVLLKTLGVTLLMLAAAWWGLKQLFDVWALPWLESWLAATPAWAAGWLSGFALITAGFVFALGLAVLVAPVSALVAGLFLDDIAELVESRDFPADPPGRPVPTLASALMAVKFFGVVVLANLVALLLLLLPGVNLVAFLAVNAYLLGREFFEFAAMRFRSEADAKALRRRHAGTVFLAGVLIAGFLAVPLLNLLTPLFAATLMVHLHKRISAADRGGAALAAAL